MSAIQMHRDEPAEVDGFRPGKAKETAERLGVRLSEATESFWSQTVLGQKMANQFAVDLRYHYNVGGVAGALGYVRDFAEFEYRLRASGDGFTVAGVELGAGMEVLNLLIGLIMLSVGLLVYAESKAAMPTPDDPELANASDSLDATAVSVVDLSKVAFIIGAAAIMLRYLIGGLGGGLAGGGGGLQ